MNKISCKRDRNYTILKEKQMMEGKLQWHVAFAATLKIELNQELKKMQILVEHLLGKKPMQIDLLVIKKEKNQQIEKNIGRIFKTYNIIEYKSPDDYISINDFYKVYGYACFYQSETESVGEIDPRELTITFVCYHYPRKMLQHIKEVRGISSIQREAGIYELIGDPIKMQVIVVKELSKEENYWLQILRNDLQSGGELRELLERYESKKDQPDYQAMMDVVTRANWEKLEEERDMCEALKELFAEEFQEATEIGKEIGERIGEKRKSKEVSLGLKKIGMTTQEIAQIVGEQIEIVQEWICAEQEEK